MAVVLEGDRAQQVLTFMLIINALQLAFQLDQGYRNHITFIDVAGLLIVLLFMVEVSARIFAEGWHIYRS